MNSQNQTVRTAGAPVNAFSIDVEDDLQVAALARAIPRDSWPNREYRVEANTERVLNVLAEKSVSLASESPKTIGRIRPARPIPPAADSC